MSEPRRLFWIDCKKSFHLATAVGFRMEQLGYTLVCIPNVQAYGFWGEYGRKEQLPLIDVPQALLDCKNIEDYEIEEEDNFTIRVLDLHILFDSEEYKYKKPEFKIRVSSKYNAIVKEDHVLVGCQKIPFDTVEKVYNAIQSMKKEVVA